MSVSSSKNTVSPGVNTVEYPKKWKCADVLAFLEANKEEYDLDDNHIDIIRKNEVSGERFLKLTKGELLQSPYELSGGAATRIEELINHLKHCKSWKQATSMN